jgi:hypothetical protein
VSLIGDVALPEDVNDALVAQVRETRDHLGRQLRAQAEQLQRLEEGLRRTRVEHERLEEELWDRLEALGASKSSTPAAPLDAVLAAARNLFAATSRKQALSNLTEEACRLGVRAAAFEVRGEAAWAASAHGFGPQLSEQTLRSLVVPLNVDTPFRQVFEGGEPLAGNSDVLKQTPNVLNRLKPDSNYSIRLLPVRSASAVSAILYADSGASGGPLPENALDLLVELAGAHLDRLTANRGRARAGTSEITGEEAPSESKLSLPEAASDVVKHIEQNQRAAGATLDSSPGTGSDVSQLTASSPETNDPARQLARLLVFEIELYNQAEVSEGRANKDLYKRLKADIERSRQVLAKRFGGTAGEQFDYFQHELVRTLAGNDPSLLGSDCPSV